MNTVAKAESVDQDEMDETVCKKIEEIIVSGFEKYGRQRNALMPLLQDVNHEFGYVPEFAMVLLSDEMKIPKSEIYGVVGFYSFFSSKPKGKYVIRLCRNMSCVMSQNNQGLSGDSAVKKLLETLGFVKKAPGQTQRHPVTEALMSELNIDFGETTEDGLFTLEATNCIGMCDQSPAMMVNEDIHVKLTPEKISQIISDYRGS